MTETMLVRTNGGGWEELQLRTDVPDGGLVEVFGEDIGPVLGAPTSVVVAACAPPLGTGAPDAICLDPAGGVWIVELDLAGSGETKLPNLLSFGGALSGMEYDAFEALCERRDGASLVDFVEARAGDGFHRDDFRSGLTQALAAGRFRLVTVVREAAPTLVQSMRFLNGAGAMASAYEATSFASASVSAIRARAVDVGQPGAAPAPASAPAPAPAPAPAAAAPAVPAADSTETSAFLAATGAVCDEETATLMQQLQAACTASFDTLEFDGDGEAATMRAVLDGAALLSAGTDGSIVLSFESLSALDPSWGVRDELCQGLERLLGTDLGDVRKISQVNLSIGEHLMDVTLMDALCELLGDTLTALRAGSRRRTPAAA